MTGRIPPKPAGRRGNVPLWRYARLFRRDILSAQPDRLYGAWMAVFRTPFFRSAMVNDPELINLLLKERPADFPKSGRVSEGLRPLLGNSVFLTNGDDWARQRRIIDPAFEGGRLRDSYPAMRAAAEAAALRFEAAAGRETEVEAMTSHAAADVIFRTLFSVPIEDQTAAETFAAFRRYQRAQPVLNAGALVPLPRWMPRLFRPGTRAAARRIRGLIGAITDRRQAEIAAGTAPADLATAIMTTNDPETGARFEAQEMIDQVAIFFLAGHETSASALAWALYLLALYPEWQEQVASEALAADFSDFTAVTGLRVTRDVFRETLRLYPPVPMMVRETTQTEIFRKRRLAPCTQVVISPWHLHRHSRLWKNPDAFDPGRWQTGNGRDCARRAYIPFSAGPRVCPGAGFAMIEGACLLAHILAAVRVELTDRPPPVPVAHLTVRAQSGIWLRLVRR
ncbi:cytochrome P450 [Roseobacter ponti]|uniref:Cytochrome P450 n=1 Tax=Roseobacter ponti TaxID=1891787 RepID=A0A858SU71_9RHOB|nr:cytochrome P450 [Roseobacter ponti]QJF51061.1 cytochrome P450 [Roseobacter ponti]